MRNHKQGLMDGGLAVGGALALIADGILDAQHSLPAGAYPLAALAAAPLAFRRQAPLRSLLGVEAGAIACVAVFGPGWAAIGIVMVALFTVALLGDRQRSLLVGAGTGIALVGTILLLDHSLELTGVALRLLLVLAALVVGDTVRSRRALRAAFRDRIQREERQREEESRQRVANEHLRLARDLHDTVAHALVAINVRAGVAEHLRGSQDPWAALRDIKEASAEALRDLRSTLSLLRDHDEAAPVQPVRDLEALPTLVERVRGGGLEVGIDVRVDGQEVPSPVGQAAFRIVQEALTNVLRHAGASHTQVLVATSGGALHVEITDDGSGGTDESEGHGLRGMKERAGALGGRVVTGPRLGGGWRVDALLPLPRTDDG